MSLCLGYNLSLNSNRFGTDHNITTSKPSFLLGQIGTLINCKSTTDYFVEM